VAREKHLDLIIPLSCATHPFESRVFGLHRLRNSIGGIGDHARLSTPRAACAWKKR